MNDAVWGDDVAAPKKSGVPKWVFWCCGSCLLAVILAVISVAVLAKFAKPFLKSFGGSEASEQLPSLNEALPFDPLPPELQFEFAIHVPMDWYIFTDSRGYAVLFFVARGSEGEELRRSMLNPDFGPMGLGRREGAVPAKIQVQGREVGGIRFVQKHGSGAHGAEAEGQSVLLEVGPEAGSKIVIVQITRRGSSEPITDDEVRTLLEPFHVGTDR